MSTIAPSGRARRSPHQPRRHEVRRHLGRRRQPPCSAPPTSCAGRRDRGLAAVVVVSAMAKVTDQFLAAAAAAGRGDKDGAIEIARRSAQSPHREAAVQAGLRRATQLSQPGHRPRIRCARRSAARHRRCRRTHAAHQRQRRQLRRAHVLAHGRRLLSPSMVSMAPTSTPARASSRTTHMAKPRRWKPRSRPSSPSLSSH